MLNRRRRCGANEIVGRGQVSGLERGFLCALGSDLSTAELLFLLSWLEDLEGT